MSGGGERRAVFRLECGGGAGWGHLARCAALAGALGRRGWTCVLWTGGDLRGAPADLRLAFQDVVAAGPAWMEEPGAGVLAAEWVVVDHYGLDDPALRRLAGVLAAGGKGRRLLVLDDECRRRLDAASLVWNARLGLSRSPYAPGVRALLGERYALLRPGLAAARPVATPFPPDAQGVLVMLGGTDPRGLTPGVLEALADVDAVRFSPVVIRARASPDAAAIRAALDRFAASAWVESVDAAALAGWARGCRYAVSAAGGTLYELALLGLPFVALVVAGNQRAFGDAVASHWRMPVVDAGSGGNLGESVARAFRTLVDRVEAGGGFPARVGVDGRGPERVAAAMEGA